MFVITVTEEPAFVQAFDYYTGQAHPAIPPQPPIKRLEQRVDTLDLRGLIAFINGMPT